MTKQTETEWVPPSHWSPEVVEYWKSLDHDGCTQYRLFVPGEEGSRPMWEVCASMHCPACGRRTGSQGHLKPGPNGEHAKVCPTPVEERKVWPGFEGQYS